MLEEFKLLDWVIGALEDLLSEIRIVSLIVRQGGDSLEIKILVVEEAAQCTDHDVTLIATTLDCITACVNDPKTDWIRSLLSLQPMPQVCNISINAPQVRIWNQESTIRPVDELLRAFDGLRASPYRESAEQD